MINVIYQYSKKTLIFCKKTLFYTYRIHYDEYKWPIIISRTLYTTVIRSVGLTEPHEVSDNPKIITIYRKNILIHGGT